MGKIGWTGLVRAIVVMLVISAGCSTPPDVTLAHQFEKQAMEAYRSDVRTLSDAFLADLDLAWSVQRRKVLDYELLLREDGDGRVDLGEVQTLLDQERAKAEQAEGKLERIRATVDSAEANYQIAEELHGAIGEYLERDGISEEDQERFVETAAEAAGKITRERGRE